MEIKKVKNEMSIEDEPGRDDFLYMTSIPVDQFFNSLQELLDNPEKHL
jgi:chloramphenicol O-acetyltransferase type A